jgi:hypothetical protein
MWYDEELNDEMFHSVSFKLLRDMLNNQSQFPKSPR